MIFPTLYKYDMTAKQFIETHTDMTEPPNWDVVVDLMNQYASHIASHYIKHIGELQSQHRSYAAKTKRQSTRDEIAKLESFALYLTSI